MQPKKSEEEPQKKLEITPEVEKFISFGYLRDKNRHKRGVLAAYADPSSEHIYFSVSFCMPEDDFDPKLGFELAKARLESGSCVEVAVGDLRYVLHAAGVRETPKGYQRRVEHWRSNEIFALFQNIIASASVTQDGWDSLGIVLENHVTTLANVVKWAKKGVPLPW